MPGIVAAAFAGLLAPAPVAAEALRADAFDKRAKPFVVHDAPGIRSDDVRVIDGRPDVSSTELGRVDLVFTGGIAYDPKRLLDSVRGRIGR
jgi:hypothetical protein